MFEQLIPPELREALLCCSEMRCDLERGMAWVDVAGSVPERFAASMNDRIARLKQAPFEILDQYRRREITLDEAIKRLGIECDVDQLEPPNTERTERRSSAPPT